jgi:hypothetical protein
MTTFFENIDWPLLSKQKLTLIQALDYLNDRDEKEAAIDLEGILCLIDSLQDYAVDDLGYDDNQVFPGLGLNVE